jgi:hypothetical protein
MKGNLNAIEAVACLIFQMMLLTRTFPELLIVRDIMKDACMLSKRVMTLPDFFQVLSTNCICREADP